MRASAAQQLLSGQVPDHTHPADEALAVIQADIGLAFVAAVHTLVSLQSVALQHVTQIIGCADAWSPGHKLMLWDLRSELCLKQ